MEMKNNKHLTEYIFNRSLQKAQTLSENADENDIKKIKSKLQKMKKGPIAKIWNIVERLYQGFLNPDIPHRTKLKIIGALLYLICPADIIPDIFLPAGLLDDVAVIAFIYSQCKDLLERMIPLLEKQIKDGVKNIGDESSKQIDRLTEEALEKTLSKKFTKYVTRIFLNSLLKLLIFITAMLLLYFFTPKYHAAKIISSILIITVTLWSIISIISTLIRISKNAIHFFENIHLIHIREKQNSLTQKNYTPLSKQERIAEALYKTFVEQTIKDNTHKKFFSFIFKKWNEGALPAHIPQKKHLARHIINVMKIRLIIFVAFFSLYIIVYNFLVKGLLLQTMTDFTFWQLLVYPLTQLF